MNSSKAAVLSKVCHSLGAAHESYSHGAHCRSCRQRNWVERLLSEQLILLI